MAATFPSRQAKRSSPCSPLFYHKDFWISPCSCGFCLLPSIPEHSAFSGLLCVPSDSNHPFHLQTATFHGAPCWAFPSSFRSVSPRQTSPFNSPRETGTDHPINHGLVLKIPPLPISDPTVSLPSLQGQKIHTHPSCLLGPRRLATHWPTPPRGASQETHQRQDICCLIRLAPSFTGLLLLLLFS